MHHRHALLLAVLLPVLVHMALHGAGFEPDRFGGPDTYMRLLQVERLWLSGDWFDRVSPLTNYPFGETLHWTRPLDLLLLAGAAPLNLVTGTLRESLWLWSLLLGPLLQGLAVLALSWGTRPLLSDRAYVATALLFCALPLTHAAFVPARPDHHGLQLLLYFVQVMILLRALHDPDRTRTLLVAGLAAGLGLWVSPEALLGVLILSLALGLLWLVRGKPFLSAIARYFTGLAIATLGAFLLDRPPGEWSVAEYDRISIAHLTLVAALAATWTVLASRRAVRDAGRGGRLVAGLVGALVPALVMLALFPKFFGGPFVDVDPRMQAAWFDHIREVRPLLSSDPGVLAILALSLGTLPAVVGWAIHRLRRPGNLDAILFLVAIAVPLPLALAQVRWSPYVELGLSVPLALLLRAILLWERPWPRLGGTPVPLRVPAFVLVFCGPMVVSSVLAVLAPEEEPDSCRWPLVAPQVRALAKEAGRTLGLLTFVHQGPEVVWRTGQGVVGSPYQRNAPGVLDTHAVLGATDPEAVRPILDRRRIDYVLLCRKGTERRIYKTPEDLVHRLMAGTPPDWLHRRPLSGEANDAFVFYAVEHAR